MSFAMSTEAMYEQRKTVTRRQGWQNLQPGTLLWAVEKGMGLKKGERVRKIGLLRVVHVDRLPIHAIDQRDVDLEGFDVTPEVFIRFYCRANKVTPDDLCTRIEFEHV